MEETPHRKEDNRHDDKHNSPVAQGFRRETRLHDPARRRPRRALRHTAQPQISNADMAARAQSWRHRPTPHHLHRKHPQRLPRVRTPTNGNSMMRPFLPQPKWKVFKEDPQYAEEAKWVVWDTHNQERVFKTGHDAHAFLNAYLNWYGKTFG
jgi:hypothetical protein